jgi:tetratricopeptide (TPR) repeat protein
MLKTIQLHFYQLRAGLAFMNGNLQTTLKAIDRLVDLEPASPDFWSWRGRIHSQLDEAEKAEKDFERAFDLLHYVAVDNNTLSLMYLRRGWARNYLSQFDDALVDYSESLKYNPENWDTYQCRAAIYGYQREFAKGIADYDSALQIGIPIENQYLLIGRKLMLQVEMGIKEAATALNEYQVLSRFVLGRSSYFDNKIYQLYIYFYFKMHDYEQVIAICNHVLKKNPKDDSFYINRGLAYSSLKNNPAAIADFEVARTLAPKNAVAFNNLGYSYLMAGELERVSDYLEQALQLDPELAPAYGSRGHFAFVKGEYTQALSDFQREREFAHNLQFENYGIGGEAITRYQLGQIEEAKALWRTLRERDEAYRSIDRFKKENTWSEPALLVVAQLIDETAD